MADPLAAELADLADHTDAGRAPTRVRVVAGRFRRDRSAGAGALVVLLLFVLAFAGPHLTHWAYSEIDYTALRAAPSAAHWWGTNAIGQDVFAQTVRGLQKSLLIGLAVAVVATTLAAVVGAVAGYLGGWAERGLVLVVDLLLVFPSFLIIAIVSPRLRGGGWVAFVGLLAVFGWMVSARVVRSLTISLKELPFVRAARFMGVSAPRIIVRHVLPSTASFLIIDATLAVGAAVMTETSLSYFGFGVQPPDVSLGTLIAAGTPSAVTYPWMFFFPAGLLVVFVLAVNLVGDGLRDAVDPRSRPARPPLPRPVTPPAAADGGAVLEIRDLRVSFGDGPPAVDGVDLTVHRGQVLGVVGESGSGKSVTVLAALGLLPAGAAVSGSAVLGGTQVVGAAPRDLRRLRGNVAAVVFQDSLSALTPVYRIGDQLAEAVTAHRDVSRAEARRRAVELLRLVGIPSPELRARAFPDELSGGMRQRVMIAMAIANDPDLILADEPTTALDVTVQAQILRVLRDVREATGAALVLVSHDLGVVAGMADEVAVMRAGRVVERAPVRQLYAHPQEPYTRELLRAQPRLDAAVTPRRPAAGEPVLRVRGLRRTFGLHHGRVLRRRVGSIHAVDGVDLTVHPGQTHALVGESGSGKSTTLLEILGLRPPEGGTIELFGRPVTAGLTGAERAALRARMQLVFQDPFASLDPRLPVGDAVAEPLLAQGRPAAQARARVAQVLRLVGLDPAAARRFPHEFSGGQRQRIAIARAISVAPDLLVLDEPVSSLDVTVRAAVLDLLARLQAELGLAYLFVTHDLAVVARIADVVSVMYLGRTVETGPVADVLGRPLHPYTRALLSAVPVPDPVVERRRERILLPGDPPAADVRPTGCRFRPRCPLYATLPAPLRAPCEATEPDAGGGTHRAACHHIGLAA
ncbi:dipeptide ABC transporter ATP-binding protein [Dactylosporangium aurantiacum]|uniref:Dipeptide ABC transporter ATP-binding protein n=1 Tax=Dactylosporangium aurantiacum TaxID=35754 RepID=A0A9Q9ISY4_9ACTN|nr:dipeptide ABC transporter ATP-binding protein [Dactylosporangium aurantiacum]MDG6108004.1 dipeptide ABC transporter ATP-binding protein [Dactylosporangium aurantiacum]UWZ59242.1 dipeptide ABC transporter ATP-binding protein [Dactylosporangium aurantiacum]